MDRKRLKLISTLLALLMFVSPISSLAMQPVAPDNQSGHCHGMETESQPCLHEGSDQASCTMENCEENCNSSLHCSSQAPIILSLFDTPRHPRARGEAIGQLPDTKRAIHLSGLFRPPRL